MKSLKFLQVSVSILISVVVISTAIYGHTYIKQEQDLFIKNSNDRSVILETVHIVTNDLSNASSALEDLSLVPEERNYLDSFYSSLDLATANTGALIDLKGDSSHNIHNELSKILVTINKLDSTVDNHFKQYLFIQPNFLNNEVEPIFDKLSQQLYAVDMIIDGLSNLGISEISNSNQNLIDSVTYLAAFSLFVIVIIFFSVNKLLLTPLHKLTTTLERSAKGEETEDLPLPKYKEMHLLMDAFINMQNQVKLRQTQLEHQALHDGLTGLPNRILLHDRIQQLIKDSQRNKTHPGIIMLDLDRFKEINDTLGHHVGDMLLQDVSKRLANVLRNLDSIARLGGDEFAVLLHDVDLEGAKVVANKITNCLALPFQIENHQLLVRCSQGIALYPDHGENHTDLMKHADVAMYVAKRGHFGHSIYNAEEDHHNITDISLSADLKDAINNNELQLFYQPKVDSKTGKVLSTEALLRWIHPDKGFISPEVIVDAAEQSGLIHPLTEWVIQTAINQTAAWQKTGIDIGVAVNLSAYNLQNPHLVTIVKYLLDSSELAPSTLTLEVTESAMMTNPKLAASVLTLLNNMGLKIAIDDFGTGYSSLAYLKNLPVHELKIDRSFVMNIVSDKSDVSIVKSTIDLAHNLNLSVVAEGVEDRESWDILDDLGCDIIQGYYVSRPIPMKDFEAWYVEYSLGLLNAEKNNKKQA